MTVSRLSRTLHKWLALFVGLQLLIWTASGLYTVVVDLDFIHGDTLVRNLRTPLTQTSEPAFTSPRTMRASWQRATNVAAVRFLLDAAHDGLPRAR